MRYKLLEVTFKTSKLFLGSFVVTLADVKLWIKSFTFSISTVFTFLPATPNSTYVTVLFS